MVLNAYSPKHSIVTTSPILARKPNGATSRFFFSNQEPSGEAWKTMKIWKSHAISCSILTTSFYFLQMLAQRAFGLLKIHGGVSNPLVFTVGLMSTTSNLFVSQNIENYIRKHRDQFGLTDHLLPPPSSLFQSQRRERRDQIKRTLLSLGTFLLLEQNNFRSAFPSSVISLGVFGNLGRRFRLSIPTDSALTTEAQRKAIQKLGRRYGCHHCGSRQLFSKKVFIADHMPPTKIAEQLSKSWWRRILKRPIQQRLWPQCFKCYGLQGHAVRNNLHVIAYHNVIKRFHFAPAIAFLLLQEPTVNKQLDTLLDPLIDQVDKWITALERHLNK